MPSLTALSGGEDTSDIDLPQVARMLKGELATAVAGLGKSAQRLVISEKMVAGGGPGAGNVPTGGMALPGLSAPSSFLFFLK